MGSGEYRAPSTPPMSDAKGGREVFKDGRRRKRMNIEELQVTPRKMRRKRIALSVRL